MLVQIVLKKDQILMTEGEDSDVLYLLLSGELAVYKADGADQQKLVGKVLPNEMVGEMSFLDNKPRSATVKALTDCKLKMINRPTFDKLFLSQDPMMQKLVTTLSDRLRVANTKIQF